MRMDVGRGGWWLVWRGREVATDRSGSFLGFLPPNTLPSRPPSHTHRGTDAMDAQVAEAVVSDREALASVADDAPSASHAAAPSSTSDDGA